MTKARIAVTCSRDIVAGHDGQNARGDENPGKIKMEHRPLERVSLHECIRWASARQQQRTAVTAPAILMCMYVNAIPDHRAHKHYQRPGKAPEKL